MSDSYGCILDHGRGHDEFVRQTMDADRWSERCDESDGLCRYTGGDSCPCVEQKQIPLAPSPTPGERA